MAVHWSLCRRKEGRVSCPSGTCILLTPPCLPTWDPQPGAPRLLLEGPSLELGPLSCARAPLLLGLNLAAITAYSGQPERMALYGFEGWPAGARLLVLRPARGPWQGCLLPLTYAQGWLLSSEGQPTCENH